MIQYVSFPVQSEQEYQQICFLRNGINNCLKEESMCVEANCFEKTQSKQKHFKIKGRILFHINYMEGSREYLFKA